MSEKEKILQEIDAKCDGFKQEFRKQLNELENLRKQVEDDE